jgi:hypothetical protein
MLARAKATEEQVCEQRASARAFGLEAYGCIDRVDLVLGLWQHSCSQLQVI